MLALTDTATLSVSALFAEQKLAMDWVVKGEREITPHPHLVSLFGYLNPIRALPIQVVSETESEWIYGQTESTLRKAPPLSSDKCAVIILTRGIAPNPLLQQICQESGIALVVTRASKYQVFDFLHTHVQRLLAVRATVHGVMVAVNNVGVLITGASGIGKSEVALDLIQRNHQLIADDAVELYRNEQGQIIGQCPDVLRGKLEIRGLGIIDINHMFGPASVLDAYQLQLIINLQDASHDQLQKVDRLQPSLSTLDVLGADIDELVMMVVPGRNLSALVDAAIRDHLLRMRGIDSSVEFLNQHDQLMKKQ